MGSDTEVICPYCGKSAELIDSAAVYGRSYGMMWMCWGCNTCVGTHKHSPRHAPLGRLANAELREWKKRAHRAFDPIWKQGHMSRKGAYSWLARQMGMDESECHIGMFDVAECKQVCQVAGEDIREVGGPF